VLLRVEQAPRSGHIGPLVVTVAHFLLGVPRPPPGPARDVFECTHRVCTGCRGGGLSMVTPRGRGGAVQAKCPVCYGAGSVREKVEEAAEALVSRGLAALDLLDPGASRRLWWNGPGPGRVQFGQGECAVCSSPGGWYAPTPESRWSRSMEACPACTRLPLPPTATELYHWAVWGLVLTEGRDRPDRIERAESLARELLPGAVILWRVLSEEALRRHHRTQAKRMLTGAEKLAAIFSGQRSGYIWQDRPSFAKLSPAMDAMIDLGVELLGVYKDAVVLGVSAVR